MGGQSCEQSRGEEGLLQVFVKRHLAIYIRDSNGRKHGDSLAIQNGTERVLVSTTGQRQKDHVGWRGE
jgi:hypothetical protein